MPLSDELRSTKSDRNERITLYATATADAILSDPVDVAVLAYVLGRVEKDAKESYHDGERVLRGVIAAYFGHPADPHANEDALEQLSKLASVPDEPA